ncbi:copine (Calcium-dependent phospholipid-binding protein) family [Artemisia annua]|uniref:Copine (Calcium-dependent phospholipid-binding protein) family n=1 Tax=Artemisia annua TaxID=35608 RepID=A0A2U1KX44_ARTAN|nr:copine (Calcium-dependent phospholipid-binding protein) family [Artemisia annua]
MSSISFQLDYLQRQVYHYDDHEVFDEMSVNKFLKKQCTVVEYYNVFNSSFSDKGFDERYLIDLFIFGLQPEIEKVVRLFKPNTLHDAYNWAMLQENVLKHNQSKEDEKENSDSGISVVGNDSGRKEQREDVGNDIVGDEVMKSSNANEVIEVTIGLMGTRLMGCNETLKNRNNPTVFHYKDSKEVDGKTFIGNGSNLDKIQEAQMGAPCLEDYVLGFDKVPDEVGKSSLLEVNESSKMDVNGAVSCKEDGKYHGNEPSGAIDDGIGLKDLVEFSKEGDANEKMTSIDSGKVEDNELEDSHDATDDDHAIMDLGRRLTEREFTIPETWNMGCGRNDNHLLGKFYEILYDEGQEVVNKRGNFLAYGQHVQKSLMECNAGNQETRLWGEQHTLASFAKYIWKWPRRKKASSHANFKFMNRLWKFDLWEWRKRICGAKCELKYKKRNFDICKWPKRKKIVGIKCRFRHGEWEFGVWKWPNRKKKRASCYVAVKSTELSVLDSRQKEAEVMGNVIKCFGKEIATENTRMGYNFILEFASHDNLADVIKEFNGKGLMEIGAKFGQKPLADMRVFDKVLSEHKQFSNGDKLSNNDLGKYVGWRGVGYENDTDSKNLLNEGKSFMGDRLGKKDCLCISSTDMQIYHALFWDADSNGDKGSDPEWILCWGEKQLDFWNVWAKKRLFRYIGCCFWGVWEIVQGVVLIDVYELITLKEEFDEANLIPCYGFGDATTHDQHVFSFYPKDRSCNGFEDVMGRYREIVPQVTLAGPTSFAPVIEQAMTIVEKSGDQYHVLLIIVDGQVGNGTIHGKSIQEKKTVDAIDQASKLPLSIVLVGVGERPWDMMKKFDDNISQREFNNFQFVNFTEIMSKNVPLNRKEAEFALTALMEIPSQYKATIELQLLGSRRGNLPQRAARPPPIRGPSSCSSSKIITFG